MKARHFINEKDKPYKNIEDFNETKNGDFYYIDTKTAREFCEYYHIDGYRNGSEKYGI